MRGIASTGATPFLSPMLEDDPVAAATNNDSDRSSIHERNLRVIFDCINICSDPKLAALQPRVLAIKLTAFISCLHLVYMYMEHSLIIESCHNLNSHLGILGLLHDNE